MKTGLVFGAAFMALTTAAIASHPAGLAKAYPPLLADRRVPQSGSALVAFRAACNFLRRGGLEHGTI